MSPEDFSNISQGVQSLLLAAGVICAGIWALVRLRLFGELSRAKLEASKLERVAREKKGMSLKMDVSTHSAVDGFLAIADVVIENPGMNMYYLDFTDNPFKILQVEEFFHTELTFKEIANLPILGAHPQDGMIFHSIGFDLLPGTTKRYSFCYHLKQPGAYLFSFIFPTPLSLAQYSADADERNYSLSRFHAHSEKDPIFYKIPTTRVERFVYVGGSPENPEVLGALLGSSGRLTPHAEPPHRSP